MSDALTTYGEMLDVLEHLPLILRETRRQRGVSQRACARQTGTSFSTISRVENGEDCTLSNAMALLRWIADPD